MFKYGPSLVCGTNTGKVELVSQREYITQLSRGNIKRKNLEKMSFAGSNIQMVALLAIYKRSDFLRYERFC